MSYDLLCHQCGATSGPSVGVCPFCKTVLASAEGSKTPAISKFRLLYEEGKLDQALLLLKQMTETGGKYGEDPGILVLGAKVLLETEGPTTQIKGLLGKAFLLDPNNPEIPDYLEIVDAKFMLRYANAAQGIESLQRILRRNPNNIHANFILGAHLSWREEQHVAAIPYLERVVRLRPVFLRAWACLGVLAKKLGNLAMAEAAFRKCIKLENAPFMRAEFERQLASIRDEKKAA